MVPASHVPIVVTHQGDVTFAAQVRSHRVIVDQTLHGGGADSAPTPIELLGVSLGTCIAFYVQQFCQARGVLPDGMRVEVDQHSARNPNRIGEFAVRVTPPTALPDEYLPMLKHVVRSCPAHNTLTHGAQVHVEIEALSASR